MTLGGLCRAVAARGVGGILAGPLIFLIWGRLRRIERQFLALVRRLQSGGLRRRVVGRRLGATVVRKVGGRVLPRRFGWLLDLVPHEAACFAGQLRAVLDEPEMVALLAASPEAGRILAPLCRMLGVEAGVLAPVAVRVAAVAKRVLVVLAAAHPGRVSLPRGVVLAARRQGFGRAV